MTQAKKNLVVLRAGPNSLHKEWAREDGDKRSWDVLISFYDEGAFKDHKKNSALPAVLIKGGKWDGLYKTLSEHVDLERYDRFWLPDDDISARETDINQMFELAAQYDLAVCQPSLTHNSFFSHFLFTNCPAFKLRYTNYVEIMVPCLTRALLQEAIPMFYNSKSGYGLDYLWCRLPSAGAFRCAILDSVTVFHTRPIGKTLRVAMSADKFSLTPEQEEAILLSRIGGSKRVVPLAYAGINRTGEEVSGRLQMAKTMVGSYWKARESFPDQRLLKRKCFQTIRRHLFKELETQKFGHDQTLALQARVGQA